MARGRKIPTLTMTAQERETLERWARRPTTAQAVAMRARVVLASAGGRSILDVARQERISWATAKRWRTRFIDGWMGCSMSRGPARRGRSATPTSSA